MIIIQIDKKIEDLHAIEHDINTRFPTFQFKDGLKPYDLSDCSVRVYGVNSLVNSFFNDLEIVNAKQGIAKLQLTDTMLVKGTTKMQFVIMPNDGGQLKTKIFNLVNGESLVDSEALEGSDEYKAFEEALKKLEPLLGQGTEVNKGLESNIRTAADLDKTLKQSVQTATSTKQNLDNSNSTATATNQSLNNINSTAIRTKEELNQLISIGNIQAILDRITELETKLSKNTVGGTRDKGYEETALADRKVWVHEYGVYNASSGGGVKVGRIDDIITYTAVCRSTQNDKTVSVNKEGKDIIRFYHNNSGTLNIIWHAWGYKKEVI